MDYCQLCKNCCLVWIKGFVCDIYILISGRNFVGKNLKPLLWKTEYCTHPQAWEAIMREIKDLNVDAFKHLIQMPIRHVLNIIFIQL